MFFTHELKAGRNVFYFIFQNYFRDPWNVFDFITVVGSIVDVLISLINIGVSIHTYTNNFNSTQLFQL